MLLYYWKDTTHPPPFPSFFFSCENSKTTKKQCGTKNTIAMGRFGRIRAQDNYWRDGVKQDKVFVKISETFNKPSAKSCYKWWWIYVAKYQWFGAKKKHIGDPLTRKSAKWCYEHEQQWNDTWLKRKIGGTTLLWSFSIPSARNQLLVAYDGRFHFRGHFRGYQRSTNHRTAKQEQVKICTSQNWGRRKKKTGESNLTKKNLNFTCPR